MSSVNPETLVAAYQMRRMMTEAVRAAQQESREMGVPNTFDFNGHMYFELPDGTIATEDPWHGERTPPDDWPWRDRWEKNVAQKLEERRKRAAGLVDDQS